MHKVKAIVSFSGYTGDELRPIAEAIHEKMSANAATFPSPPTSMSDLGAMVETYRTRLSAKTSRATADFVAFDQARETLQAALRGLGNYVNSVARGDVVIVEKSGFPFYSTAKSAGDSAPSAPTDVRLRHGILSGQVALRCKIERPKPVTEVQKCFDDPNVAANWEHAAMSSGRRALVSDLPPGALVWLRIRVFGNRGLASDWSDPAQIRVI
jgi:hypothetical protein